MTKNRRFFIASGLAIAILVLGFSLFTFLPFKVPAPEPFSPFGYLAATIISGVLLYRIPDKRTRWLYALVPAISFFGFLEETSYGVEWGLVAPLEWNKYHVQVYDIHNLIPVIRSIVEERLSGDTANLTLLNHFLAANTLILLGGALFLWVLRRNSKQAKDPQRAIDWLLVFSLIFALAATAWLFSLPADAKNSWLLGYSASRWALGGLLLLAGMAPLALTWVAPQFATRMRQALAAFIESAVGQKARRWLPGGLLLLALLFQILAILDANDSRVVLLLRLAPGVLWMAGLAALFLFAIGALGQLAENLQKAFRWTLTAIRDNPAFVLVALGVVQVVFAQVMDEDIISLREKIHFANPWGEDWNYWIEETLETVGGFQLLAAVLFYPTKRRKIKS